MIGCDGIGSRVRRLLVGAEHPSAHAGYTHKYTFRGLVPMARAASALGDEIAYHPYLHLGKGAALIHYPIDGGKTLNVAAFVDDAEPWPPGPHVLHAHKADMVRTFTGFGFAAQTIASLLDENVDRWGLFDMYDHPVPIFAKGRVAIAGDAAHASTPYHGAGAGMGIEDAAALSDLLVAVTATVAEAEGQRAKAIVAAFGAFDATRRERAQWLVRSSRQTGGLYTLQDPTLGPHDPQKLHEALMERFRHIWEYDWKVEKREADTEYQRRLGAQD